MIKDKETVYVGLSGGVDSSVAALLLKQAGHEVVGVFMRCVNLDGCADDDAYDARRVAEQIGIPFYTWDFEEEYQKRVVDPMISGYKEGITPNPDVACNKEVKFGLFLEAAKRNGATKVATGHYARVIEQSSSYALQAGVDKNKDQSYFLWTLDQGVLPDVLFPLGALEKPEVRKIAEEAGLHTAKKKDSQGICFLGKVSLGKYLRTQLPSKEGKILDGEGNEIGIHDGAWFFTIGQASGFEVRVTGGSTPKHYVAARAIAKNTITVVEADDSLLEHQEIVLDDMVLTPVAAKKVAHGPVSCLARIRYRQPLQKAQFFLDEEKKQYNLLFAEKQSAVALGQSTVLYDENGIVLGGGIISKTL